MTRPANVCRTEAEKLARTWSGWAASAICCDKSTATACAYPHTYRSSISTAGESPDCPSLRASSDHRFIVGALRARRAPGCSFPILPNSLAYLLGAACLILDCARRTSIFPIEIDPSKLARFPFTGGWPAWSPTARVQRAPSERARCASTGDQQAPLPIFSCGSLPASPAGSTLPASIDLLPHFLNP